MRAFFFLILEYNLLVYQLCACGIMSHTNSRMNRLAFHYEDGKIISLAFLSLFSSLIIAMHIKKKRKTKMKEKVALSEK